MCMLARPQLASMQFVRDECPFRSCRIHMRRGISIEKMLIQCVESCIIFIALVVKPEKEGERRWFVSKRPRCDTKGGGLVTHKERTLAVHGHCGVREIL